MTLPWYVYIILCSDNSLYTGITTDIGRRFQQHRTGRGAKYFRGRQPLQVVYQENGHSRSTASRREAQIKSMNRTDKDALLSQHGEKCPGGQVASDETNPSEKEFL
jgi:putative endonuclease